jgi:hypothetical protein
VATPRARHERELPVDDLGDEVLRGAAIARYHLGVEVGELRIESARGVT